VVHGQLRAAVTGFLSLDAHDPLPKVVLPEKARVDVQLSRQLTLKVQREARTVWLGARPADIPEGGSLVCFKDAVCVPLFSGDAPLGALHVYSAGPPFTERQVRFCEVLAGYLANSLRVLRSRRTLEAENTRLRKDAQASEDQLLGDSPPMQRLRQHIRRVAPQPCTVLVIGESGVGKELVALAIHRQSPRRDGPLVSVNCAAIPENLIESALFGTCKGGFTGAEERTGYFLQADEGTLFLDEIGEMAVECQAKLLRVLETKKFRPVGATEDQTADFRIVAATNRDLEREIAAGRFREDLFYRLDVQIHVPPLRDRASDIPVLVHHFLDKLSVEYRRDLDLTPVALERLQDYTWPGNVRQLRSVLVNAVANSDGDVLDVRNFRLPTDSNPSRAQLPALNLKELEAWAIRLALDRCRGNKTQTARLLGIDRDTLYQKMKKYEIDYEGGEGA
jgi:transcriptional regulator with PAS, ATPase and Fis domain